MLTHLSLIYWSRRCEAPSSRSSKEKNPASTELDIHSQHRHHPFDGYERRYRTQQDHVTCARCGFRDVYCAHATATRLLVLTQSLALCFSPRPLQVPESDTGQKGGIKARCNMLVVSVGLRGCEPRLAFGCRAGMPHTCAVGRWMAVVAVRWQMCRQRDRLPRQGSWAEGAGGLRPWLGPGGDRAPHFWRFRLSSRVPNFVSY